MDYVGSFDPGYGGGKVVFIGPQGLKHAIVPSIVGMGDTDIGQLGISLNDDDLGRQRRRRLPDRVVIDDVTYLVGAGTERYAVPMDTMDFLRLRGGPTIRALFYDCIYRALGAGDHDAALLIGLPVEVLADGKAAGDTVGALRDWMVAEHQYSVNEEAVKVTIRELHAMAQPVGAFFAWGFDDNGRWIRSADALEADTGVLDIGFNTLDLFAVGGGELTKRYTDGDTLGMRRAAEHLIKAIGEAYGKKLSLHQADALIRDPSPTLSTSDGRIEIKPLVGQALSHATSGILSFVQQPDRWGDGRQFDHLLITGGGAEALRSQLQGAFPHGYILPHPVTANALGLARYARRAFRRRA
jgi:hypothetical protein